jgi:hypothetical protein
MITTLIILIRTEEGINHFLSPTILVYGTVPTFIIFGIG